MPAESTCTSSNARKPTQNAYAESFAGKLRKECLNAHRFTTLSDALATIQQWRREYNEERPHSALDYLLPKEFARSQIAVRRQAAPQLAATL